MNWHEETCKRYPAAGSRSIDRGIHGKSPGILYFVSHLKMGDFSRGVASCHKYDDEKAVKGLQTVATRK
jgi:hypothetical protein